MKEQIKISAVMFLIGSVIGMFAEQQIILNAIKKDCEILSSFRIGDTAFICTYQKK